MAKPNEEAPGKDVLRERSNAHALLRTSAPRPQSAAAGLRAAEIYDVRGAERRFFSARFTTSLKCCHMKKLYVRPFKKVLPMLAGPLLLWDSFVMVSFSVAWRKFDF
ncbi:hypothetical protein Y032_0035g3072 [Ancylostoma ceylanicum]|uniref:Uncharacterized protein n=1 Tax=Ancylostoma ceylanicum TaxID=53326 RepID=A0A016UNA8_9BILA|nr:hypothetical protein Y032_0035g3072 [Ancylostoma ceylanicum]